MKSEYKQGGFMSVIEGITKMCTTDSPQDSTDRAA